MRVQGTTATTTGATTANVLTGTLLETAPANGVLRFMATGEAAGESRLTIMVGARVIMEESSMSRQARPPIIPDDVLQTVGVRAGERIVMRTRNTGAGTNTIFWAVDFVARR